MKKAKHGMTTDEFKDWLKWWKSALKQSEADAKKMITDLIKKHKLIIKEYPYSNEFLIHVYPNFLKDTFSSINKK